ncbi:DUF927 domain-containing protein [Aeromonas veronii]|uniref:DUF927 domain-containing protein n=1 Tax=Aeromonas veronii TaxID=654 RepID=UPI0030065C80
MQNDALIRISTTASHNIEQVRTLANGNWASVLADLEIDVDETGAHGPCPVCGGSDRFRFDDLEGRGTWFCNQCDPHAGDGFDLVRKVHGVPASRAINMVGAALGMAPGGALNPEQLAEARKKAEERKVKAEQDKAKLQADAAHTAGQLLDKATPGHSPYLAGKGFNVEWRHMRGNETLIPLQDEQGQTVSLQTITADGEKKFLYGGALSGAFYMDIGDVSRVSVCEGLATGLSVQVATGDTIFCAMTAGNLRHVAQVARRMFPDARITLAADNDEQTDGNPGKAKAEEAAAAVGGVVALPPVAGDWNDYHKANGLEATREAMSRKAPPPPAPAQLPGGYQMDDRWLYSVEWQGKGEDAKQTINPLCQPLHVLAESADENGSESGLLLQWKDRNGRARMWAMPRRMLISRNGDDALQILVNEGLQLASLDKRKMIAEYLVKSRPAKVVTCVSRTGWFEGGFVLPQGCMGRDDVLLQSGAYIKDDYTEHGTLTDWREQVAALAVGNSRLCFALSTAFAAPLLSLVGMGGGGFHLKGESTDGKTTIMLAAASVYGHPEQFSHTWRATGNALEGIASRRNDALLCLDELGEVDGREAGSVAYMLANGQGKGRSRQDGELRQRKSWRLLFLSTGELSLEDHAAAAGQRTQAGMEVRTVQIPSDTGKHGAFEVLHGMAGGREFADTLRERCQAHYGVAFRAYVGRLTDDLQTLTAQARADVKRLADELTPQGAGNQVGRAINRFALVAAAGEMATRLGVTGWAEGEATKAARICLNAWLAERGHLGNQEDAATLSQIRQFFTAHQFSRFASWDDPSHRPHNMVGYRKAERAPDGEALGVKFYVLPEGWKEITKGRDPKKAAKLAMDAGWIAEHDTGRLQKTVRIPISGDKCKPYVFSGQVMAD